MGAETMSTDDIEAARERNERRKRYEQWMDRCIWGGMLGLLLAMGIHLLVEFDPVLWAGSLALVAGYVGYVVIEYFSPMQVRDERQIQIEHEAGRVTIYIVGFVFVFLTPMAVTADVTGTYEMTGYVQGIIHAYVFLSALLVVTSWWFKRKNS